MAEARGLKPFTPTTLHRGSGICRPGAVASPMSTFNDEHLQMVTARCRHHRARGDRPLDRGAFANGAVGAPVVASTWGKVDDMRLPKALRSPERDVLLVSALISILVVLAFTDWGVLAAVLTGLVFAALLLASTIANVRDRRVDNR